MNETTPQDSAVPANALDKRPYRTGLTDKVREYLKGHPWSTSVEVAAALGEPVAHVTQMLRDLHAGGKAIRVKLPESKRVWKGPKFIYKLRSHKKHVFKHKRAKHVVKRVEAAAPAKPGGPFTPIELVLMKGDKKLVFSLQEAKLLAHALQPLL